MTKKAKGESSGYRRDARTASGEPPATINQVALHAGVSRSTVSNVANGLYDRVNPRTFERVAESIRLLNYKANNAARLLRSRQARPTVLGFLVPSIANPFCASLAGALDHAARERGFDLLLRNTGSDQATEHRLVEELVADGIRCVALASSSADESILRAWIHRGLCVVSFDRLGSDRIGLPMDTVSLDNFHAGHTATRHLIENGHTAIAYATQPVVTRQMHWLTRCDRRDGYLAAMEEAGLDNAVVFELPVAGKHPDTALSASGRQIALKMMGRRNRPTGIVAMNDLVALSLIGALHSLGVRVPDDVSIVGIDGLSIGALSAPALTTMHQPLGAIAGAAIEMMHTRLVSAQLPATAKAFRANLIARASVRDLARAATARMSPDSVATTVSQRSVPEKT